MNIKVVNIPNGTRRKLHEHLSKYPLAFISPRGISKTGYNDYASHYYCFHEVALLYYCTVESIFKVNNEWDTPSSRYIVQEVQ